MSVTNPMKGARLEYVVRKIRGTVMRTKYSYDKKAKKLVEKPYEVADAFMVYMPNGHSYRLTLDELERQGYDKQPGIINLDRVTDANTPAGRFKFAVNEETRRQALNEMEEQIIRSCRRQGIATGTVEQQKELIDAD